MARAVRGSAVAITPAKASRAVSHSPAASAANKGIVLYIANTADNAEVITIKDGVGTICTPTQNESAIVWSTGSVWDGGTVTST
jgi:hypothetical protein